MNNSPASKNILLVILAVFSAFSVLRLSGLITTPFVRNAYIKQDSSRSQTQAISKLQINSAITNCDPCTNRYSLSELPGGSMISNVQFVNDTLPYQRGDRIDTRTRKIFVTKRAIDYMFNNNCAANGLNCYFGMKRINSKNKLTLILTATTSNSTVFTVPNSSYIMFESDILCPDECGSGDTTLTLQLRTTPVTVNH